MDLNSGKWLWGKLSVAQLDATLDLLETNGNSKLLSDPRITVTENHEAEIKIATVIPIQTLNRFTEGAAIQDIVSFEDEEVGISLRVTARINAEGTITLDVAPQVDDIIGYTGPANNQRPIKTTRSIRTRITVNDGESVALGGLLKDDVRKNEQRLPLLGKIPFFGKALFTHTSTEKTTTDLVIFITPKIVK
jgi:type II secretory pathway component GspD/PulD (secretin)